MGENTGRHKEKKEMLQVLKVDYAKTIQTREKSSGPRCGTGSVNKEYIRHP